MAFLYEYMTDAELEAAKEQAEFENASMKLDHALECLRMEHAIRVNNIDTECMINEYTQEDLENMYTREMAMYMEGAKEWWAKFKAWVSNIIKKITGKKNSDADAAAKKSDEEVELDYDPKEAKTVLAKVNGILHKVTDVKKDDGSGVDPKKLASRLGIAAAAAAATAGAVFLATKKKTKVKKSELPALRDEVQAELTNVDNTIQGLPEPSGDDAAAQAQAQSIKDIGTGAVRWGQDIINQMMRHIMGGGNASADGPKALPPASDGGGTEPKQKERTSSASKGSTGAFTKALGALKRDPELDKAWKALKKWGRKEYFSNGFTLDACKQAIAAAKGSDEFTGDKSVLDKILKFMVDHDVQENVTYEMTWDDIDDTAVPTMESTDFDFITEGTEFTTSLKELLDLADML